MVACSLLEKWLNECVCRLDMHLSNIFFTRSLILPSKVPTFAPILSAILNILHISFLAFSKRLLYNDSALQHFICFMKSNTKPNQKFFTLCNLNPANYISYHINYKANMAYIMTLLYYHWPIVRYFPA